MATRKLDAATAERLAEIAEIADRDRALEIGDWTIEWEDGRELHRRVERLRGTSAPGNDPPGDGPSRG